MIKKLALDKTKVYEKKIALVEISQMLVNFVKGRVHNEAIGSEQGEINTWDDFVIETEKHYNKYLQVKRQTTPFSNYDVKRELKKKGPQKNQDLQDLSPLDDAIAALATVMLADKHDNDTFWLYLPEPSVLIKKGLTIGNLRTFKESISSLSESSKLDEQIKHDKISELVCTWLTTWCGFTSNDHIIKAFNRLYINTTSYESEIYEKAKNLLLEIFNADDIDTVCTLIMGYCEDNETFSSAIRPRELLFYLRNYLRTDIERWSKFETDNSVWNIAGIHDICNNNCCERANVIVKQLWNDGLNETHSLIIAGKINKKCCLTDSLLRLCVHLKGPVNVYSNVKDILLCDIENKTGSTLGTGSSDIGDFRIMDLSTANYGGDFIKLETLDEVEKYSDELSDEMFLLTLKYVDQAILKKISIDINKSQLRTDAEKFWHDMNSQLQNNISELKKLFIGILHPDIESKKISGELRTGLRTVEIISNAIFMYIVIKICIKDYEDPYIVRTIGLNYWSGPADDSDIYTIDDSRTIDKLLSNQMEDILLLAGSRCPASEIYNYSLAGETTNTGVLSDIKYPKLLITNDERIKSLIRLGDIEKIKEYLTKKLDEYKLTYKNAIKAVVGD